MREDGRPSSELEAIKSLLQEDLKLLMATIQEDAEATEEIRKLLQSDSRLEELWRPWDQWLQD